MGMMKQYSQFTVRTQFTQKAFSFLYNKKLYFCEIIIKNYMFLNAWNIPFVQE